MGNMDGPFAIAADSWYNDYMNSESRIRQAWIIQRTATAWPTLPEHIKAAVLALVRSIPGKEQTQ